MEKYVSIKITTDYIVADTSYFIIRLQWVNGAPISDEIIKILNHTDDIIGAGKTYGEKGFYAYDYVTEDYIKNGHMSQYYSPSV